MKILLIAALLALARADVSHVVKQQESGYQYQQPETQDIPISSYGVPQSSVLGNGAQSVSFSSSGLAGAPQLTLPSPSGPSVDFNGGFSTTPSPINGLQFQAYNGFSTSAPSVDLSSFQGSTPAPSVDLTGFQVSTPSPNPTVNLVQYSQPQNSYQFLSKYGQPTISVPTFGSPSISSGQLGSDAFVNSGFSSGSFGSLNGNSFDGKTSGGNLNEAFGIATDAADGTGLSQESEVSKHLYFFAAPEEEEEEVQAKIELPATLPKKTYKIIFIKAPAYRNQAAITIPAPPQNEEKTLVYVLVKKPDNQPKVKFQDAAPTQPSKPEVFFIKYKTQKEAEAAVAEIQNKHGASGHVIANLPAGTEAIVQPESGISVSTTPSSVSFGGSDIGSISRSGFSFDSLGANSFVSSTPATVGFESKISDIPGSFASSDQGSIGGEGSFQFNFGQGGISQSPTPVTFGDSSVDSLQVFGGGIAPSISASAQDSEGSSSTVESGDHKEGSSSESSGSDDENDNKSETSASESEVSNETNVSQNAIEQKNSDGSSGDSSSQGSEASGFSLYGPPKY